MADAWSWEHSNGEATDEQTRRAHHALTNKESSRNFSRWVWNDLVYLTHEAIVQNGGEWSDSYASFSATQISEEQPLSARKFNSLRLNILNSGWPWSYNPARPDYIGQLNVRPGDLVYGSYILELAHKYTVMLGILDDTGGDPLEVTPETELKVASSLAMLVMRGIMVALLFDTDVQTDNAIEVINFAPTLLFAEPTTDATVDNNNELSIVPFATPSLNRTTDTGLKNTLPMIAVLIPLLRENDTIHIKTLDLCTLELEDSSNLNLSETLNIGMDANKPLMGRMVMRGIKTTIRGSIRSTKHFNMKRTEGKLLSISGLSSSVGTSSEFEADKCVGVLLDLSYLTSSIGSSLVFNALVTKGVLCCIDHLTSDVASTSTASMKTCTDVLIKANAMQSGISLDLQSAMIYTQSLLVTDVAFYSEMSLSGSANMVTRLPYLMDPIALESDISTESEFSSRKAYTRGAKIIPFTHTLEEESTAMMGSEANLMTDADATSEMHSECRIVLGGELTLFASSDDNLSSLSEFDGSATHIPAPVAGVAMQLTISDSITMIVAPAWIYPVQTDDDLYIVQAREIEQNGSRLTIE